MAVLYESLWLMDTTTILVSLFSQFSTSFYFLLDQVLSLSLLFSRSILFGIRFIFPCRLSLSILYHLYWEGFFLSTRLILPRRLSLSVQYHFYRFPSFLSVHITSIGSLHFYRFAIVSIRSTYLAAAVFCTTFFCCHKLISRIIFGRRWTGGWLPRPPLDAENRIITFWLERTNINKFRFRVFLHRLSQFWRADSQIITP